MIYRIAIYHTEAGERKFSHYANEINLSLLRVTVDGKVEKLTCINQPRTEEEAHEMLQMPDIVVIGYHSCQKLIYANWLDVSATHEVEWGFMQNNKPYYVNDRLESKDEETIYYDTKHQCFAIGCRWLELRGENGETEVCCDVCQIPDDCGKVIGNIHEHPELMEEK